MAQARGVGAMSSSSCGPRRRRGRFVTALVRYYARVGMFHYAIGAVDAQAARAASMIIIRFCWLVPYGR